MRVLYFTKDYTPHDYRFLEALARTSHQVFFLRLEARTAAPEDRPLPSNIEWIRWPGGATTPRYRNTFYRLLALKEILRQLKPDIVHAGPIQPVAYLVARSGFKPLVSMSWGYDLLQEAHKNQWMQAITRFTLAHSDMLIGDCQTVRQVAIRLGISDERVVTFPWGVDLNHFTPSAESSEAATFVMISTRSWEEGYGIETIAQAFTLVHQRHPHTRLMMLGNGSKASQVKEMLARGGVLKNDGAPQPIVFPGVVRFDHLPKYYQAAHLYLAATHSDGTSISLLEAMACGLPVIVSDIPGNREWVVDGENGWLFPVGDAQALARRILTAIEKQAELPQMGMRGRKIVEQRANWEANFPLLLQAYERARHSVRL